MTATPLPPTPAPTFSPSRRALVVGAGWGVPAITIAAAAPAHAGSTQEPTATLLVNEGIATNLVVGPQGLGGVPVTLHHASGNHVKAAALTATLLPGSRFSFLDGAPTASFEVTEDPATQVLPRIVVATTSQTRTGTPEIETVTVSGANPDSPSDLLTTTVPLSWVAPSAALVTVVEATRTGGQHHTTLDIAGAVNSTVSDPATLQVVGPGIAVSSQVNTNTTLHVLHSFVPTASGGVGLRQVAPDVVLSSGVAVDPWEINGRRQVTYRRWFENPEGFRDNRYRTHAVKTDGTGSELIGQTRTNGPAGQALTHHLFGPGLVSVNDVLNSHVHGDPHAVSPSNTILGQLHTASGRPATASIRREADGSSAIGAVYSATQVNPGLAAVLPSGVNAVVVTQTDSNAPVTRSVRSSTDVVQSLGHEVFLHEDGRSILHGSATSRFAELISATAYRDTSGNVLIDCVVRREGFDGIDFVQLVMGIPYWDVRAAPEGDDTVAWESLGHGFFRRGTSVHTFEGREVLRARQSWVMLAPAESPRLYGVL